MVKFCTINKPQSQASRAMFHQLGMGSEVLLAGLLFVCATAGLAPAADEPAATGTVPIAATPALSPASHPVTPAASATTPATAANPAAPAPAPAATTETGPASPAAEPEIVTELRRSAADILAKLLAANPPADALEILIDKQPHLVKLIGIDKDRALQYKEFGRSGSIPFDQLTTIQLTGLLLALVNDELPGAAQAHLYAGLLSGLEGKVMECSAEIDKAVALDETLEAVAAEKIKLLPKPVQAAPVAAAPTGGAETAPAALEGGELATPPSTPPWEDGGKAGAWPPPLPAAAARKPPGLLGPIGTNQTPACVGELNIDSAGVYANYLIDGGGGTTNLVNIHADNVVLRYCEVRNARRNGVQVYAKNVLIENSKIHHLGEGSLKNSEDCHGITGRPHSLTIRNCEIYHCSGDSVQFDPARAKEGWTDVLIENCEFWIGPLDVRVAGFNKGEIMGENAVDTKNAPKAPRARLVIRNSVFHGFRGGQASAGMRAALNIKDNVACQIDNCVFYDNGVGLRLRGPGTFGGALVQANTCYFYDSEVGVRYEDNIQKLVLTNMAFGDKVAQRYDQDSTAAKDLMIRGDRTAPLLDQLLPKRSK